MFELKSTKDDYLQIFAESFDFVLTPFEIIFKGPNSKRKIDLEGCSAMRPSITAFVLFSFDPTLTE